MWDSRATLHHAHLAERTGGMADPALADAMGRLSAAGLTPEQAMTQVNRLIDQQAFTRAADDIFLGSVFLFLLLIGVIWFARPVRANAAAPDTGGAH